MNSPKNYAANTQRSNFIYVFCVLFVEIALFKFFINIISPYAHICIHPYPASAPD